MVNKVALTLASVAAVAALTVALAAAGFAPRAPAATPASTVVQQETAPPVDPTSQPQIVYDNVYVRPAPSPETIVVRTKRQTGGEQEHESGESESEGSDG